MLNTKNTVQKIIDIAVGATSKIYVEPKDILKEAIRMEMPKIIMVHNHPSGDETPSIADKEMTNRVEQCAKLFGIQLIDHIVIGDGTFESILSKMHKRRILLYYYDNLSLSDIAEIEGCSKVAIKYSIDNAIKQLREFFEKN